MNNRFVYWLSAFLVTFRAGSSAQTIADTLGHGATLENCVQYALLHQPLINQSLLDEQITERSINSKLADWYPQLNFNFNLQHNAQLPTSIFQGNAIKIGLANTSVGQFSLTQTLFNRDVLLASSSAEDVRKRMKQLTIDARINAVVNVSKAYYAVLVTDQQINLLDEDITRLKQSQKDAYDQYKAGLVDKIDYQRATIALNNASAERQQNVELLKARLVYLKDQMGYPPDADIKVAYDSTQMEQDAIVDTTAGINYEARIEYQLLQTVRRLDEANLSYNEWSFLPSISAFGNYNLNYQNAEFAQLYGRNYPSSSVGLLLSIPLFEGGKRIQQIKQAQFELQRTDEDIVALKNSVSAEYAQAAANYRSDVNNYRTLQENLNLAREVFNTIQLQYKAGTKTYLEVITAETDLRAAQVNRTNALFQLLSGKLDLQKALGSIRYQ